MTIEPPTIDHFEDHKDAVLSSQQESKLIHYCDQKILDISRAYKNRAIHDSEQARSTDSFQEILESISTLLGVLFRVPSGSCQISISYLLLILGGHLVDYISVFDATNTVFDLLQRVDVYLAELLTKEKLNGTERARLSSIAMQLRSAVYEKFPGTTYEAQCSGVMQDVLTHL